MANYRVLAGLGMTSGATSDRKLGGVERRALVIGHDHVAGIGHLEAILREAGYILTWFTVVPAESFSTPAIPVVFPDASRWDLVVTLGAPWPVEEITTWTATEVDFLRSVHDHHIPVLGICFGAQLLAEALGGGSEPMLTRQIGWREVTPTGGYRVPIGPWFQWHTNRLVLPPEAEELAISNDGVEVFRVGSSIGVQFHPEMTPHLLEAWLELPGSLEVVGDQRDLTKLRDDTLLYQSTSATATHLLMTELFA